MDYINTVLNLDYLKKNIYRCDNHQIHWNEIQQKIPGKEKILLLKLILDED